MTGRHDPLALLMDAVAEMRHAQKEYFRTRGQTALVAIYAAKNGWEEVADG